MVDLKNAKEITEAYMRLSPFERYVCENEYIQSLPVLRVHSRVDGVRGWVPYGVRKLYQGLRLIDRYIYGEVIKHWSEFFALWNLRNTKKGKETLVLGNGPSQDFLSLGMLNKFRAKGGEVFVVNFWNQNKRLSSFVPDYITISDPATLNFSGRYDHIKNQNSELLKYIKDNPCLTVICPLSRIKEFKKICPTNKTIGFVDLEMRFFNSINPIFPRGYVSITLLKSLAMSKWLGFKKIYVLGMDNTYPRNTYCSFENETLNHEVHAGGTDYVLPQGVFYKTMGDLMLSLSRLFKDALLFREKGRIFNLDPFSLTDAFEKIDIRKGWPSDL